MPGIKFYAIGCGHGWPCTGGHTPPHQSGVPSPRLFPHQHPRVGFFFQCVRHQIQCLWAQSWMAAQLGPHIYMPGIKYDAFGCSHGWLRNMCCHEACFAEFIPVCIARPRVHSSERQDRSAAFFPCLLYTSPSPRDKRQSRMPSSA